MIQVTRHGLFAHQAEDVYFLDRVIRYALLAMQNSDTELFDQDKAVRLHRIAQYVAEIEQNDFKVLSIEFLSTECLLIIETFKAAKKLTLVFDEELYRKDLQLIETYLPKMHLAQKKFMAGAISGQLKYPTQLSFV